MVQPHGQQRWLRQSPGQPDRICSLRSASGKAQSVSHVSLGFSAAATRGDPLKRDIFNPGHCGTVCYTAPQNHRAANGRRGTGTS